MCAVPVFYATTEGQTRRIAEHLAIALEQYGLSSRAIDVTSAAAGQVDWTSVRGVILGASLHGGKHQRSAARFVRAHRGEFNTRPSAFFSVSLGAGSANRQEVDAAQKIAARFAEAAGWRPARIVCFPGRLAYTRYGGLKRVLMRRIAMKEGGPTDTSRDHEFTNWRMSPASAPRSLALLDWGLVVTKNLPLESGLDPVVRETYPVRSTRLDWSRRYRRCTTFCHSYPGGRDERALLSSLSD
jgi:menaquinone-dependent protoporphyrinogen oxidase